jgi:hypothetical protein
MARKLQTETPASEEFAHCFHDYDLVVSEASEEVIWEKRQIEATFANQLQAPDDFGKRRLESIYREGLYLQQLRDDRE